MTIKLVGSTSGSVALDAPASTTSGADVVFKLPVADGSANQHLKTDGSGNLGWVTEATGGKILQVVTTVKTDTSSGALDTSSNSWKDMSLTATITAASSSNKILVFCSGMCGSSVASENTYWTIRRGSSDYFQIGASPGSRTAVTNASFIDSTTRPAQFTCNAVDTSPSTSSTTYYLMGTGNNQSGTLYLNRTGGDSNDFYRPRGTSTMILMEVGA